MLRAPADAGDGHAAAYLGRLLAERGDVEGLHARTDAGDDHAAGWLSDLLEKRRDLDGAERVLRVRPDACDGYAAGRLADPLATFLRHDGCMSTTQANRAEAQLRAGV